MLLHTLAPPADHIPVQLLVLKKRPVSLLLRARMRAWLMMYSAAIDAVLAIIRPQTNSDAANHVRDTDHSRGALLIDKWRRFVIDGDWKNMPPAMWGNRAYDEYRKCFPEAFDAYKDKPAIRSVRHAHAATAVIVLLSFSAIQYFVTLIRNTKAAIARDLRDDDPRDSAAKPKETRRRRKKAHALVDPQLYADAKGREVDMERVWGHDKPRRAPNERDTFAKLFPAILAKEKEKLRKEFIARGGVLKRGQNTFHHSALSALWKDSSDEQKEAVRQAIEQELQKREEQAEGKDVMLWVVRASSVASKADIYSRSSLAQVGDSWAQNIHEKTGEY